MGAEPAARWLVGVCMALLNCALSSVGITMQRKAQLLSEELQDKSGERAKLQRVLWGVGVLLYILAAVPDVLAYTMVPQVVCTTVACFRLVVVTVLAHTCLQERAQLREVLGMTACTLGTFLCLCFGPRPDAVSTSVSAGEFYHPQVVTYLGAGLSVLVFLLLLEHADALQIHVGQSVHVAALPLATGLAFGLEKVFNTEIGFIRPPEDLPWGLVESPQWTGMIVAIGLLGLTDFYLNLRGVQRMPMQVFLPISFALSTALQYFQSVFIFGEFREMDGLHAALSMCGALVSLAGALCIQPPRLSLLGSELLQDEEARHVELNPRSPSRQSAGDE